MTNTQKSISFLVSDNEHAENEIRNIIPFITIPKQIKGLNLYLTKHVQDVYA